MGIERQFEEEIYGRRRQFEEEIPRNSNKQAYFGSGIPTGIPLIPDLGILTLGIPVHYVSFRGRHPIRKSIKNFVSL